MKNQNIVFIAIALVAFALAPVTRAKPIPQGGPTVEAAANAPQQRLIQQAPRLRDSRLSPSIALTMLPGKNRYIRVGGESSISLARTFVNFSVSGTAIPGVDYTAACPPASIGQAGLGVILVKTLADPSISHPPGV